MAAYVLDAVRRCAAIDLTVYVGQTDVSLQGGYDVHVPPGARLTDSLALGVGAAMGAGATAFLVITADVPWVDGSMLDRFMAAARSGGREAAQLVYAVVERDTALAAFPGQERTFVRLRDGRFTGGNVVYATSEAIVALLPLIDSLYRARKNPFALAGMLGFDTLLALVTGSASIARLERRATRLLGVDARALVSPDAALAADVDRPAHVPGAIDPSLPAAPGGQA